MKVVERIGWISVHAGPQGLLAGSYHTCLRYPDRVAIEIDAGAWQLAQALRADGAFECAKGFQNCNPASAEVADELRDTALHANKDLLDKSEEWRAASVQSSIDGRAWRLVLPSSSWAEFDRVSGHLRGLGKGDRQRHLHQWQTVGDVTLPLRLEDYLGDDLVWANTVQLKEVTITDTPSQWCTDRFGSD
jgi:hypothetical protein